METVNIHEAKTRLSELLVRVEEGEEFVIARAGRPIAKLSRLQRAPRTPGYLDASFRIGEDFDRPDPELEALVECSELFPE